MSGLGGVGKTQTAAHFAQLHRHEYQAVLWTLADTVDSLHTGLAAMAHILELPEKDAQKQFEMLGAVKHWLTTHDNWLLVLDNADDINLVHELTSLLPKDSSSCRHLLLTTRATMTEPFLQAVLIEDMPVEEGTKFLLYRAKYSLDTPFKMETYLFWSSEKKADWRIATEIVNTLSGLPLALDQAGAYIRETLCGFEGYLERYQTHAKQLLDKRGTLITQQDHTEPVAKTWLLSFEKIAAENETAVEILNLCAFLHPDNIPEELFQDIDTITLDEALTTIFKYSLLRRNPNTRILSIHRLVQLILKHQMDETTQRAWAEKAVRVVNDAFLDPSEISNWVACERLLPCAQMCAELITESDLVFEEAGRLLNEIGYYLKNNKAEYEQAKLLYERALAIWKKVHGEEHPLVATSLNNLASLYNDQGKYEQAKLMYERALAINEKVHDKEHPNVAISLNNLALLHQTQGEYEQAKLLYERALAIWKKVHGEEHSDVAISLNNLAEMYRTQGKYEQAKPLYERALPIWEKVHGEEHPSVAISLNNLALLYDNQGKYEQAKPLYERALAIREKVFGKEHPNIATSLNNLASLYYNQGEYEQAKPLYERALAIDEKVYGKEHPEVATDLNNLALLHQTQGEYEQAKPLYERALKIANKFFKPDHPKVHFYSENYASLLEDMKKPKATKPPSLWKRLQQFIGF